MTSITIVSFKKEELPLIIREHQDGFIFIEQDQHARLSGSMIKHWNEAHLPNSPFHSSIIYAIDQHDVGWKPFDQEPFWNDQSQAPYSFTDFPNPAKTVLYTAGIESVEAVDVYASLLCSVHYTRFLEKDASSYSQQFVVQEKNRQHRIIHSLEHFDAAVFAVHSSLLQLCDNLSLFICLNEPGENKHPFFVHGIPLSAELRYFTSDKLAVTWKDKQTIALSEFPFTAPATFTYPYKWVAKRAIIEQGLIPAYKQVPVQETTISFM
ncbi:MULTISPECIES: DUF3891 family protein [Clostridia]|uniref:DUF3891 family protein n=1 Tax=Clostridia TaxID=186801 RepID=UPI000EA2EEFB|nr:DUF3891 family protein [Roseburia sp. 1XD42-34]RKI82409.1 DUF3891 family protein [Clostridium sp. 1xD42-85]